jgi:dynein heavy chain 1
MSRISNVLGDDWGQQLDGRTLRRSCDELLAKLDAKSFLRSWISQWEKELILGANSRSDTFPLLIVSSGREKEKYEVQVNMDSNIELLFREVRTLTWLGFEKDIPRTLRSLSEEALIRFPYAISLRSSLRSYSTARKSITPET